MTHAALSAGTDGVAEVRAHDQVVRYRRSGSGAAVLLLDTHAELWPEFPAALAQHFHLIVPDLPGDPAGAPGVLSCLLDGLGRFDVSLVASGRWCDAAIALALGRNEFVGRVVLVPEPEGPWTDLPAAEQRADVAGTVPLFVIPRRVPVAEALDRTVRFLGGRADAAR